MIEDLNTNIPIPWPSIQTDHEKYFLQQIIEWSQSRHPCNPQKKDSVKIYDYCHSSTWITNRNFTKINPIFEYPFLPVSTLNFNKLLVQSTYWFRQYKRTKISCHSKILFFLDYILRSRIKEFIVEAKQYFQITELSVSKDQSQELIIIAAIQDKLQEIYSSKNIQLIPNLYYNLQEEKLLSIDDYIPPLGIDDKDLNGYSYEYIFSKTTSDFITDKLIQFCSDRKDLLNIKTNSLSQKNRKSLKDKNHNPIWEINDIILPDYLESFKNFEQGFIDIKTIMLNNDGSYRWAGKRTGLIAFIIILFENGYINKTKFKKYRIKCRKVFEERYDYQLGQSFESARIQKQTDLIETYKSFPVFSSINEVN